MQYTSRGIRIIEAADPFKLVQDMPGLSQEVNAAIGEAEATALAATRAITVTAGTNLDSLTTPGRYALPASGMGITGGPYADPVGTLIVDDARNSTGNIQTQTFIAYNPARMFVRDRNSAGFWQSWRTMAVEDPTVSEAGAGRRAAVVDAGLARRGRVVGTRGRPAVALRFDHHTTPFLEKVLPLLQQHRLPWGQMLNANRLGSTGTEAATAAQMQTACIETGGEVWNHSWSHSDVVNVPQADREVTRGLTDLKAALPELWIDGWAGPGQANYMGLEGSDAPGKWWGTYPGRLVLAQHAFIRGYHPGLYTPLAGPNLIGAVHAVLDAQDPTWASGVLRGAINARSGVTFMLHPNYLDQSGYMTTAQLGTVLADIAARRDAGELVVLTPTGVLMADIDAGPRNLLATGTTAGTITSSWTETVSGRQTQGQYGVPHEAAVTVKALTAGTVTLSVAVTATGGTKTATHTRTLSAGQTAHMSVPVTPPLSTTTTVLTLTGNLTHAGITYSAV